MLARRSQGGLDGRVRERKYYGHFIFIVTPLLVCVLIIAAVAPLYFSRVQAIESPIPLHNVLSPLLAHSQLLGALNPGQRITLSLGLRPRNEGGMRDYMLAMMRPNAINSHPFLTPAQYQSQFSPQEETYTALQHF